MDFDGKVLWTRNIARDHGLFGLAHGYASSPLLDENSLYVQVLHGMKTDDPSYLLRIEGGKLRKNPPRGQFKVAYDAKYMI